MILSYSQYLLNNFNLLTFLIYYYIKLLNSKLDMLHAVQQASHFMKCVRRSASACHVTLASFLRECRVPFASVEFLLQMSSSFGKCQVPYTLTASPPYCYLPYCLLDFLSCCLLCCSLYCPPCCPLCRLPYCPLCCLPYCLLCHLPCCSRATRILKASGPFLRAAHFDQKTRPQAWICDATTTTLSIDSARRQNVSSYVSN